MRMSLALLALLGCADEEPTADPYKCIAAGGAACFQLPTKPIAAADSMGNAVTPVLECSAYQVSISAAPVTFTGKTVNLFNGAMIPGVRVEAFTNVALTEALGEATSDDMGSYTLTIDAMPSLVFTRTSADGNLPFVFVNQRIDVSITQQDMFDASIATKTNVSTLLEGSGDRFLAGKSQLIGTAFDCAGNRLVNVVTNVAPGSGANGARLYEDGVKTYYAHPELVPRLARRTELMQTTTSGGFAAANLAPGRHFIQVWGFTSEAALMMGSAGLKMLGEVEIMVPSAESAISVAVHDRL